MEETCPECGASMSSQDTQNMMFDCGSMYHRASGDMLCPCDVDDEEGGLGGHRTVCRQEDQELAMKKLNVAVYCTKSFSTKPVVALQHYGAKHGHTVTELSDQFDTSKYDCVLLLEQNLIKCSELVVACVKTGTPIYWTQLGLLRVSPKYSVGPIDGYLTLGEHWSDLIRARTDYKFYSVGSLKTDWINIQVSLNAGGQRDTCVVIDQPVEIQGGKNAAIPDLSMIEYVRSVRRVCPKDTTVCVLMHYSRKLKVVEAIGKLKGVKLVRANVWDVLAKTSIIVTMFSTLGLESAGAGLDVVSFIPAKYISERTLNMADYGIPTYSNEDALEVALREPVVIDKEKMLPFLSNVEGPSTSDRIFDIVARRTEA